MYLVTSYTVRQIRYILRIHSFKEIVTLFFDIDQEKFSPHVIQNALRLYSIAISYYLQKFYLPLFHREKCNITNLTE